MQKLARIMITTSTFHHILTHKSINQLEETGFKSFDWQYFRILNDNVVKCVICDIDVKNPSSAYINNNILSHHISNHSEKELQEWKFLLWPLKYFFFKLWFYCDIVKFVTKR